MILLAGKQKRKFYTDKFLINNGAALGSTIIMTETAFMTTEAWVKMTPKLMKGYRSLPYIKDNPQWWFLEITDGFGAHHNSLEAMELRYNAKCISLKEEGDSSHVNQAYDKFVAKGDKRHAADSLSFLRGMRYRVGSTLDQYSLVHVVLNCVRNTKKKTWVNSFRACNLDPRTRIGFKEWCDKISQYLLGGQTFKVEDEVDAEYIYEMMPGFWRGMTVEERKKLRNVITKNENKFTVQCLKELHQQCHIPYNQMHHIRVIHECVNNTKYAGLIDIVRHANTNKVKIKKDEDEVVEIKKKLVPANHSLNTYLLKPKGMKGMELFNHMLRYRGTHAGDIKPNEALGIDLDKRQAAIIMPSKSSLRQHEIMQDAIGQNAQLKVAKRKLDNLGFIQSHSGIQNNPERIERLKNQLEITASLAEINAQKDKEKEEKLLELQDEYRKMERGALQRYMRIGDKITKKEICSLLYNAFNNLCDYNKDSKKKLLISLNSNIEKHGREKLVTLHHLQEKEANERALENAVRFNPYPNGFNNLYNNPELEGYDPSKPPGGAARMNNDRTEEELSEFLRQNETNLEALEQEQDNNELEQGYVNKQQEGYWEA